jgi:hypothetical protein
MATDPSTGHVILFGGCCPGTFGDTWVWDGSNWIAQHPDTSPPARSDAAMATDVATGKAVLFGGTGTALLGDTWTWNGKKWTQASPATSPSPRTSSAMAADPSTGHVVLFGGCCASTPVLLPLGGTWTWNGGTWTEQHPAPSPEARFFATAATDPAGHAVVLFSGQAATSTPADTWTLNLSAVTNCTDDTSEAHPECTSDR